MCDISCLGGFLSLVMAQVPSGQAFFSVRAVLALVESEKLKQRLDDRFVKCVHAFSSLLLGKHEGTGFKRFQVVRDHALLLVQGFGYLRDVFRAVGEDFKYG